MSCVLRGHTEDCSLDEVVHFRLPGQAVNLDGLSVFNADAGICSRQLYRSPLQRHSGVVHEIHVFAEP
jgi:hypothetical protein